VAACSSASQVGAANHEFFATHLERWFRELTDKALRRGVFHSVPDLIASIQEYIDSHNDAPRPYMWAATAQSILAKVARDASPSKKFTKLGVIDWYVNRLTAPTCRLTDGSTWLGAGVISHEHQHVFARPHDSRHVSSQPATLLIT
jgi:hypothetical protein